MSKSTFLAFTFLALSRAQAPAPGEQAASISGQVLSAAGQPLKRASLFLRRLNGDGPPPLSPTNGTQSEEGGRFIFRDVEPGRYLLSAERSGYIAQGYPPSSNGAGSLTVAAGQKLSGITFNLVPMGQISGRVIDEDGDSVPRPQIFLYRVRYTARGKEWTVVDTPQIAGVDGTYSIDSITPGRYYLEANDPMASRARKDSDPRVPEQAYVRTFYPDALEVPHASPIDVAPGAQMRDIDVRLVKAPVFRISGSITDLRSNTAGSRLLFDLEPSALFGQFNVHYPVTTRDGAFQTGGVPPGDYILSATSSPINGGRQALVAWQVIHVGNHDVDGFNFQIGPLAQISGRITGAGAQRPVIDLTPVSGPNYAVSSVSSTTDGSFTVEDVVPAKYRVSVQGRLPAGSYVKSIRFDDQDVTRAVLDLTSGPGGAMDVVLSPNAATVSGVVRGADGSPLAGLWVTLWDPGVPPLGMVVQPHSDRTDANGAFKFSGLAPGDYRVAAWEQIEIGLTNSPEFRERFSGKAATVKLNENSQENVEAPLMGHAAIDAAAAQIP